MSSGGENEDINAFIYGDPLQEAFREITGKRSIHSQESIKFYMDELGCEDQFVLSMLEHGLRLPIAKQIPPYEEENNRSALENLDFLW